MTAEQILSLGPALESFLGEFDDCFGTGKTRSHLRDYVQGQLSDLPRKSVEPMAHLAGVAPRTLQEFLSLSAWDEGKARDRVQAIVLRDQWDAEGVAVVDESGHPKKGGKTACVQRQYCGNTGKIDNCVMTVHLAWSCPDGSFRAMLDSDLYLPKSWDDRTKKRREAKEAKEARGRRLAAAVPEAVRYRPKYEIALEQLRRARANGLCFGWATADEWYGEKPAFVAGLEAMGQRFVLEVPCNLMGWSHEPASAGEPRSEAQDLCRHSPAFTGRDWGRYHVKDTCKGPMVWEAKSAQFWMERDGAVVGPYRLMVARDVLCPGKWKYFLSDAVEVPERVTLRVGLSRWSVERCLEDEKGELGLSHFECRKYPAVLRHLLVTQLSHLFLSREAQRLRGGKRRGSHERHERSTGSGRGGADALPGPHRRRGAAGGVAPGRGGGSATADRAGGGGDPHDAAEQRRGQEESHQGPPQEAPRLGHPRRTPHLLHPAMTAVAL
jgi:SRSO17 transposase